jgi:hypothetical protein
MSRRKQPQLRMPRRLRRIYSIIEGMKEVLRCGTSFDLKAAHMQPSHGGFIFLAAVSILEPRSCKEWMRRPSVTIAESSVSMAACAVFRMAS